ncbi:uncharacterized protein M6B38_415770 [Iris pallida]|uniref:HTH myb-type domain-containing protein n=1 Tax=Iris pallida TaxID=29817 RepID=A0AAX6FKA8_IRIPA|nr:uncharacterized protein M6B38_415770 [Iris pallida]
MGSPSELSLDYKPNTAYPLVVPKPPPSSEPPAEQAQKIEDFLARLEDERHKIEAFKRELPLCMQLLNNALETYRLQLGGAYQKASSQGARPVLEEFIPLANMSINGSEKAPTAPSEKASWMVSAQLWSPAASEPQPAKPQQQLSVAAMKEDTADCSFDAVSPNLALDSKQRNGGGGAFLPFPKERINKAGALPELALAPAEKMEVEENRSLGENGKIEAKGGSNHTHTHEGQVGAQSSSTQRKARRCWSPDLHRRFVNALQMLGGSQVATPKQIRELMKVDGLTNDEVKSHLQKYRLHTRRPIPQPQPTASAAPQLVVLGGIWVPPEYAAAAAGSAIYGAHPQAHYAIPHDFYSPAPVPQSHHPHPHLHRSVPTYKAAAASIHSPESEPKSGGGGGGGDWSESIQEEEEDDDEGHGREEDEEEEEEEHRDGIDAKVMGEEKPALVPSNNINGGSSSDVALKF